MMRAFPFRHPPASAFPRATRWSRPREWSIILMALTITFSLPAVGWGEQTWNGTDRGKSGLANRQTTPSSEATQGSHQWNWYDDSYLRYQVPQSTGKPTQPRQGGTWGPNLSSPSTPPPDGYGFRADERPWGDLPSRHERDLENESDYRSRGYADPYEDRYRRPPSYRDREDRYGMDPMETNPWRPNRYDPYGYDYERDPYGPPPSPRRWRPDPYGQDPYGPGEGWGYGGGREGAPYYEDSPWGYGRDWEDGGYRGRRGW